VLIFFAALAMTRDRDLKNSQKKKSIVMIMSLLISGVAINNSSRSDGNLSILNNFRPQVNEIMDAFGLIPPAKNIQRNSIKAEYRELFGILKKNTNKTISAPEAFMPTLTSTGFGSINYFPIGLGSDDLIVVPYTDETFTRIEVSIYGLVPAANRDTWSKVITEELGRSYKKILKRSGSYGHVGIIERVLSR
jgi:hypothetical protein